MSPLSFLYMGFYGRWLVFCFASSFLFSKRLVLVFLLHSFPSISFPLFFLFFGRRSGAGGRSTCFYFLMLLSLLLFNGCLCLFLRRFGANWIYDFSRIIPLLFGLCGPKRSSVIAVREKRIYAYLNDRNPLVGFLFSLKFSFFRNW